MDEELLLDLDELEELLDVEEELLDLDELELEDAWTQKQHCPWQRPSRQVLLQLGT